MSDRTISPLPEIDILDTDGAIRDASEAVVGDTRAQFMKKAAIGGAGILGASALLAPGTAMASHKSIKNDIAILNYALTLEYLESEFYNLGVKNISMTGDLRSFARHTMEHEATHVVALQATIRKLGGKPVAKPRFNFGKAVTDRETFEQTAVVLEDTGVRAYSGQATYIFLGPVLAAAASILAVEAQHAAWIRNILRMNAAPNAFATAWSKETVLREVKKTGFIVGL